MPYTDKEKQKSSQHQWYDEHRNQYNEQRRFRREKNATYVAEIKNTAKCARCPENDACCLDFHHPGTDTEKEMGIAQAVRDFSFKRLQQEIAKCIILCANCHRKEHNGNRWKKRA